MKFDRMKKIYSEKQIKFIKDNFNGNSIPQITELFNKKFKKNITRHNMSYACKCFCGLKGNYTPEQIKRKKEVAKGNKNRWKKTNPIGSERIDKDGYILVKIGFPRVEKRKQFIVWEKYHKPTNRKTDCLIFLDGNKQNCDINNLYLMKRKYMGTLNFIKKGKETTPDTLKAYINLAIFYHDLKSKKILFKKEEKSLKSFEKKEKK